MIRVVSLNVQKAEQVRERHRVGFAGAATHRGTRQASSTKHQPGFQTIAGSSGWLGRFSMFGSGVQKNNDESKDWGTQG